MSYVHLPFLATLRSIKIAMQVIWGRRGEAVDGPGWVVHD